LRALAHKGVDETHKLECGEHGSTSATDMIAQLLVQVFVAIFSKIPVKVAIHHRCEIGEGYCTHPETVYEEIYDPPRSEDCLIFLRFTEHRICWSIL
jgi:hypothetical protein